MKNRRQVAWLVVQVFTVAMLLFIAVPRLRAQTTSSSSSSSSTSSSSSSSSSSGSSTSSSLRTNPATNFNPPPCDFADFFYNNVGISTSNQGTTAVTAMGVDSVPAQRFGLFRKTGPPAIFPGQVNWKIDNTCTTRDAVRNNVRILATTGGYIDSDGSPTDFINIMAFLTNQNFFEANFVSGDPAFDCTVPTPPNLPTSGCVVISNAQGDGSVNAGLNARNEPSAFYNALPGNAGGPQGDDMQDIVSNFEAYASLRQTVKGVITLTPCGTMGTGATPPNCFPVTSIATPQLTQDWRFATNRNAVDGSDNNVVNGSGSSGTTSFNAPYGYFCDDLLGMWIVTYFWFTQPLNPPPGQQPNDCQGPNGAYAVLSAKNGTNLEGYPIVKSGDDLDNNLEGATPIPCAAEGNEDVGGADGGAVWLICPAIADPTNGAIALDAFLDQVHKPNGLPLDPTFTANFFCLQFFGQFCGNLTATQVNSAQVQGATAQTAAASASSTGSN